MDAEAYRVLEKNIHAHWWNLAKDKILSSVIDDLHLPASCTVLELGAGSGHLLAKLPFAQKIGLDIHLTDQADKRRVSFVQADVSALPIQENTIDLLLLLDLAEHVVDDQRLFDDCFKLLKKDGVMVVFVPAFQFLWSNLDDLARHHRRYTGRQIRQRLRAASQEAVILKGTYLNAWLFPFIALIRLMQKALGRAIESTDQLASSGLSKPNPIVNQILYWIFSSERFAIRWFRFPVGVSYLCLAQKSPRN